jgi:hypothetical protein
MKSCEIDCSKIEEETNFYYDYCIKKEESTIISDSLLPSFQYDTETNEPIMEPDLTNVEEEIFPNESTMISETTNKEKIIPLDSTINEHSIDSTNFCKISFYNY